MRKITLSYVVTVMMTRTTRLWESVSDERYLKLLYKGYMGRKLDLEKPGFYTEKVQWLKLYNRNPEYADLVDKFKVKKIVADIIGEEYIIPTLGVYDRFEDIDFDTLPERFVLKCTHDSNSVVIVRDKSTMDMNAAKKSINKCLSRNIYYIYREWVYKDLKPGIIAEALIDGESGESGDPQLMDYKIFTFNGEPKLIEVDFDRFTNHRRNIYDTDWNLLDVRMGYPIDKNRNIHKPEQLDLMLELSGKLAKGIPHVRTDFYNVNGKVYFGEMTFYPDCGFLYITPPEFDQELGDMLWLPERLQ